MSTVSGLIHKIGRKACENDKYGGCSQAVIAALFDGLNIGNKDVLKSATALPGGGGWRGETCGALLGALMTVGIIMGRDKLEDVEKYSVAMDYSTIIVQDFQNDLYHRAGLTNNLTSTLCWDIQKALLGKAYDLSTVAGRQLFIDAGGRSERGCGLTCLIAAEVAAKHIFNILHTKAT